MPLSGSRLRRAAVVAATVPLALACPKERAPLTPLFEVGASPAAVLIGVGDVSSCSNDYAAATAALLDTIDGVVALVGDAVAPSGAPADYANCYDPTWGRHKARTYPTPGDLDYQTPGAAGYLGYFGSQLAQFGAQALDSARAAVLSPGALDAQVEGAAKRHGPASLSPVTHALHRERRRSFDGRRRGCPGPVRSHSPLSIR